MTRDGSDGGLSTAQRVETELRRAIVAMELRPGQRLSEAEIAERHGVSRQPAREALIGLARTRLIEVLPQRGTTVSKISVARMMQARFVREAIETAVVERCCLHVDPASRARLGSLLELQDEVARAGDHGQFQRYDELFHQALAEGAGLPLAWDALRDIKAHMDRLCQLTLMAPDALPPLVEQHRAILEAIDAGDGERARAAMSHHLTAILRALPQIEANHPHLFES